MESVLSYLSDEGYVTSSHSGACAAASGEGAGPDIKPEFEVSKDKSTLQKENKELKELTVCKICLDEKVCIVFLPCGHLVSCAQCSPAMRRCPICRTLVKGTVRTNLMEG